MTPVLLFFVWFGTLLSGAAFSGQPSASLFLPVSLTFPLPGNSQPVAELAKGKFLVASRRLGDPNFSQTVVLLIESDQQGTAGVIINRPTEVRLSTVLPDVKGLQQRTDPVYSGGPVGRTQMLLLARSSRQPEGASRVFEDVYTISGRAVLQQMLDDAGKSAKFRGYVGYAGWAPRQLELEILSGGWHVVQADAATVFDKAATEIWPELIRRSEAQWVKAQNSEAGNCKRQLFSDLRLTGLFTTVARNTRPCARRGGDSPLFSADH